MSLRDTLDRSFVIAFLLSFTALCGLAQVPQGKKLRLPWPVPDQFKNVRNPVPATGESIETGRVVYVKECLTCHGSAGVGDGPQARDLDIMVSNMRKDIVAQSDGALYYKITTGKKPMPEYVHTLKPADRWHVINYVRTLQEVPQKWSAPESFKAKKNPVAGDSTSIEMGHTLYADQCASCHGESGTGDGEEAKTPGKAVGNLRVDLDGRDDGDLFWKLQEGHDAGLERLKSLGDEERWHLINFIRTLGEKPAAASFP